MVNFTFNMQYNPSSTETRRARSLPITKAATDYPYVCIDIEETSSERAKPTKKKL